MLSCCTYYDILVLIIFLVICHVLLLIMLFYRVFTVYVTMESFLLIHYFVYGAVMLKRRKIELQRYSALFSEMMMMLLLERCSCRFVQHYMYLNLYTLCFKCTYKLILFTRIFPFYVDYATLTNFFCRTFLGDQNCRLHYCTYKT